MPRINHEAAVAQIVTRCNFLVAGQIHPTRLKRVKAMWRKLKKKSSMRSILKGPISQFKFPIN